MTDLPEPTYASNMRLVGASDQGGRPDGLQIMLHRRHAFIGHMFSGGFSVLDLADPRRPVPKLFVPAPPNTWTIHLQTADDLLMVIHAEDMFAQARFADEKAYYKGWGGAQKEQKRERTWSAGMAVYDVSRPAEPRRIGFLPIEGGGLHRIWYTGGRWAYASALIDGYTDYIFVTIDMADPTRPVLAGRYALPGMNHAAGETLPPWMQRPGRFGLHHPIVHGDTAYCSWRDACLVILDVSDRAAPTLLGHKQWAPPFGGGTHNALPLPGRGLLVVADEAVLDKGEDGFKPIWIFNNEVRGNPISIATCPAPDEVDYHAVGGHFGPHNIHENRPGTFQSETLIFATYQNAGVRVFDITNPLRPAEKAALVPAPPARMVDPRPNRAPVLHTADVTVDLDGLIYVTDYNAGLSVLELLS